MGSGRPACPQVAILETERAKLSPGGSAAQPGVERSVGLGRVDCSPKERSSV